MYFAIHRTSICWESNVREHSLRNSHRLNLSFSLCFSKIESIIPFYRLKKKRLRVRKVQFFAQWKEVVWGLFWVSVMLELTYPKEVHPLMVVLKELCYLLSTHKMISPPTSPELVWFLWAFLDFWDLCLENPLPESPMLSPHCEQVGMGGYSLRQHHTPAIHQSDSRSHGPFLLVHTSKRTSVNYSPCGVPQKQWLCRQAGRACNHSSHISSSSQEVTTPHHSENGCLGQGWQGGSCLETYPK